MTKLMTVQTQSAQTQTTQPLTVRALHSAQVMLLAALAASSLGSASAQRRPAPLTQPVQQVQIIRNVPITSAPVKPVTPPIQALPTYPNQTPPDGCTWIYRNGWQLACREMMSASGSVISSALVVEDQPGASSGTASLPTGPQAVLTYPNQTPPSGCIWVFRYGWQLACKATVNPFDLSALSALSVREQPGTALESASPLTELQPVH